MRILPFLLVSTLVINAEISLALPPARNVYSQDAQTIGIDLKIWSGYGLTINFIPTQETIKQVWLGDPTRFSITSNGKLCQRGTNDENCGNGNATVIFLRQIKPINFPNMTTSSDGSTQITIITSGSEGQKQYQFKLIPAKGQPSYTSLIIKPDSQKPTPVLANLESRGNNTTEELSNSNSGSLPSSRTSSTPVTTPSPATRKKNTQQRPVNTVLGSLQRDDANAVAYGLAVARRNRQINPGSTTWKKAQDAIKLLRQGKSRQEAISRSGIDKQVFNQLIEWGQTQ